MVDFDHTERGNSKSSRTRSCLLWGCGFSIVALLIAVGAFWSLFHYGRSEVAPTVEKFLELMDQQEYEQAYGMVGFDWKKTQSSDEFENLGTVIRDRFGGLEGGSVSGVKVSTTTQGTFAQLAYSATYAKETCMITFTLEKAADSWIIKGAHFASDQLVEAYRCPNCQSTNVVGSKYCGKCGSPIDPLADRKPPIG